MFTFALSLNEDAAYLSASYGVGQVMGFNHEIVGYDTAKEMYQNFNTSYEYQIKGMFKFIEDKKIVKHIKSGDLSKFVARYNGDGKVAEYTGKMNDAIPIYNKS